MHDIKDELRCMAGDSVTGLGTSEMATKLQAVGIAGRAGIEVIIAAGNKPNVIADVLDGQLVGTKFHRLKTLMENRKRWIFVRLWWTKLLSMRELPWPSN